MNRRDFLSTSALTLAGSAPAIHGAQKAGNYRAATIGTGWFGKVITDMAMQSGAVDIVAVCDVDPKMTQEAVDLVQKGTGNTPRRYTDYRDLLKKEKPEIVIIATPDHWHPLITIDALRAGAHVYVEKPISHTLEEGRAMVKAARESGRVVQVDLHRRVTPHGISAMKFLKEGRAGKIGMVRAFVDAGNRLEEKFPDEEPPAGMDWNMWCGPAPYRPFNKSLHPLRWRNFLDYGNGQLADWVHWPDQVLWWAEEKYPKKISSIGGKWVNQSIADAPDTQSVQWQFETFTCVWEHRTYAGKGGEKHDIGVYFYGTKGVLHLGWSDGWTFYPVDSKEPTLHEDAKLHVPGGHNIPELWANFIDCVKTGRRPICDIEVGHRSTSMALLGMIAYKVGHTIEWDGEKEQIVGDAAANKLLRRTYRAPWKYPSV